jgi:hypothetical protein
MYIDIFVLLLGKSDFFFIIVGSDIFIKKKLKRIVKREDNKMINLLFRNIF